MLRSWKLAQAFGIGVYVHWTFLLLPAWILLNTLGAGEIDLAFFLMALLAAVFGCVVLHEFGHALTARHFGIATRDITLYPIGGVARLERMSERPWEEFWIAVAGPAVNCAIAAVLALLLMLVGKPLAWTDFMPGTEPGDFVEAVMKVNVGLVLFNLLPAFPMDGGRVLRAMLAHPLGRLRATEIAASLGVVMAAVFLIVGLFSAAPFLMLVAVFVYFAGQQELAVVRSRLVPHPQEPLDVLPVPDDASDIRPGRPGFSGFTWDDRAHLWVEWRNGRPIHTISVD
jgi:Zn-dependent protease